jgi:uncharacterized alkaline shock family protein YloU
VGADSLLSAAAADAARDVEGVAGLSGRLHPGRAVAVAGDEDTLSVTFTLELEWGRSAAEVAREVQKQVSEYLAKMARVTPASVDVLFDAVAPPPPKR